MSKGRKLKLWATPAWKQGFRDATDTAIVQQTLEAVEKARARLHGTPHEIPLKTCSRNLQAILRTLEEARRG